VSDLAACDGDARVVAHRVSRRERLIARRMGIVEGVAIVTLSCGLALLIFYSNSKQLAMAMSSTGTGHGAQ
jgi:hypothetical protein